MLCILGTLKALPQSVKYLITKISLVFLSLYSRIWRIRNGCCQRSHHWNSAEGIVTCISIVISLNRNQSKQERLMSANLRSLLHAYKSGDNHIYMKGSNIVTSNTEATETDSSGDRHCRSGTDSYTESWDTVERRRPRHYKGRDRSHRGNQRNRHRDDTNTDRPNSDRARHDTSIRL